MEHQNIIFKPYGTQNYFFNIIKHKSISHLVSFLGIYRFCLLFLVISWQSSYILTYTCQVVYSEVIFLAIFIYDIPWLHLFILLRNFVKKRGLLTLMKCELILTKLASFIELYMVLLLILLTANKLRAIHSVLYLEFIWGSWLTSYDCQLEREIIE